MPLAAAALGQIGGRASSRATKKQPSQEIASWVVPVGLIVTVSRP
jgi:hypothetical protein